MKALYVAAIALAVTYIILAVISCQNENARYMADFDRRSARALAEVDRLGGVSEGSVGAAEIADDSVSLSSTLTDTTGSYITADPVITVEERIMPDGTIIKVVP